jgi:hypothetical protein
LIEFGADVSVKNMVGQTPLHWAAGTGAYLIVELLLEAGASPFHEDINGDTALHRAAHNGHLECARLLVRTGGPELVSAENKARPLLLCLCVCALATNRTCVGVQRSKTPHDFAVVGGFGELALLLNPRLAGELAKAVVGDAELGAGARSSLSVAGTARRGTIRIDKRMSVMLPAGPQSLVSLQASLAQLPTNMAPAAARAAEVRERHKSISAMALQRLDSQSSPFGGPRMSSAPHVLTSAASTPPPRPSSQYPSVRPAAQRPLHNPLSPAGPARSPPPRPSVAIPGGSPVPGSPGSYSPAYSAAAPLMRPPPPPPSPTGGPPMRALPSSPPAPPSSTPPLSPRHLMAGRSASVRFTAMPPGRMPPAPPAVVPT